MTGQGGGVRFEGLKPGLYFAKTGSAVQNNLIYTFESPLVSLPGTGGSDWQYDVAVTCKSQVIPMPPPDDPEPEEPLHFKVLKLWKGDSGQDTRPESVEIEIFCNGESRQTVILSEANHWSHTWTAKSDGSDWTVAERNIPAGYVLTVTEKGTSFVLTNTLTPDNPEEPEDPDNPNGPGDTPPDTPDSPGTSDETETPVKPSGDTPKTGDTSNVLLYMILLYVSGCALIILGIIGKRKKI